MAQKEHQEDIEERLRQKSIQGILNIANSFLSNPEVKRFIRRVMLLEGLRMGVVLAFLFSGIVSLLNVVRSALGNPIVDLVSGVTLILIALLLILRDLNAGATCNRGRRPRRTDSPH